MTYEKIIPVKVNGDFAIIEGKEYQIYDDSVYAGSYVEYDGNKHPLYGYPGDMYLSITRWDI